MTPTRAPRPTSGSSTGGCPLELLRGLVRCGPGYHLSGAVAEM
ncbi:hypothetical protein [Streptomyces sp. NPDC058145]